MSDPIAPEASVVPAWLAHLAGLGWRVLAIAVLAVVLGLITATLWTIAGAIVVSIVVAAVFAPLVLRLRARGHSRDGAAGIVWATVMLVSMALVIMLAIAFLPGLADLSSTIDAAISDVETEVAKLNAPDWVGNLIQQAVQEGRDAARESAATAAADVVGILILAVFLVFFMLRDGDKAWLWAFQATTPEKRERITAAGDDALARVGGYLRGTTILSAIVALTDLLFMLILGVPLAAQLAVLVFLGGYIPYFGGIVASLVVLAVSYSTLGLTPTIVLILLMALRGAAVGYLVRPRVYGMTVRLHPALVLLVLPAGYELAGIIGLFAAVPVTAVIRATTGAAIAIIEPDRQPPLPELVPAWLDRLAQYSWRILVSIALVALVVALLVTLPLVVVPILLATIVTAALDPAVNALARRGRSRARASAIAVGGSFLAILGLLVLAFVSLFEQADEIAASASSGAANVDSAASGQLGAFNDMVGAGSTTGLQVIDSLSGAIPALVTVTVLATLLTYYFLSDGGGLWHRTFARLATRHRRKLDLAAGRAMGVLGGYMVGTAAISLVGAGSQFVIMVVLGLPLALPVFVLSFILGFVPYIGSLISTLIAFLIAVAVGSTSEVVVMGLWTLAFNIVQGNVVSPLVYGKTVHLHPAIVLVAIPAGSAIAGVLGMFVVVPALGAVAVTWRTLISLLGESAPPGVGVALAADGGTASRAMAQAAFDGRDASDA